jgi:glutathione S-transferase
MTLLCITLGQRGGGSQAMKIYGQPNMGNPRRVAIFLAEKGIEIPFEVEELKQHGGLKSEWFLARNPFGRIPVLEFDDGRCLSETMAICRYFESLHPEPPLFGAAPLEQAIIEEWQRRVELEIFIPTSYYIRHTAPEMKYVQPQQIPAWGEVCRERVELGLRIVDRQLASNEYIAGARFSVADITAVNQLLGMPGMLGVKVPDDCVHLCRWLRAVARRPSVASTQPANFGLIQGLQL